VNDEMGSIWKEVAVAYLKVLPRNFPGGTGEKHEKPQPGQPVSGPRFELGTS
jgi:hypothetical protein